MTNNSPAAPASPDSLNSDRPNAGPTNLSVVAAWCGHGDCPTIYRTDHGTVVVQGYTFDPERAGVSVPGGESMVEIPAELLAQLAAAAASGAAEPIKL